MWSRCRTLGLCALLAFALAACDPELRELKPEEIERLAATLNPLRHAAFGGDLTGCSVTARVLDVAYFETWMRPAPDQSPCSLLLLVSAGVITEFKPRPLQTLLAHELAHVRSPHQFSSSRLREILSGPGAGRLRELASSNTPFTPEEEAEADALAARLLTDVWRGTNVGCLATADLYEDIRKDPSRWGPWLSRHPHPEQRVDSVVTLCDSELRRTPR